MNRDMNSYLFITYFYPPFKAVGSFRSYYIANELAELGHNVTVLTTKDYQFLDKQHLDIHPNIILKRFHFFDNAVIKKILNRKNKKQNIKTKEVKKPQTSKEPLFLRKLINTFPLNIFIGEGGVIYILGAIILGLFLLKNTTHIFTSFRPFSDHFVGFVFKILKPSLFWIADFRDPHVYKKSQQTRLEKYQDWWNKLLFKRASIVTTVSNGYLNSIAHYNKRSVVISNGYNQTLLDRFCKVANKKYQKFTISHVGNLYNGRRDPSILFECIKDLIAEKKLSIEDIQLNYAGRSGDFWLQKADEFSIRKIALDEGLVSHEDSVAIQKSSDINLMISWATESGGTFPAKFFEYIIAEKPILLIINGEQDEEFEFLFAKYNIYNNDKYKEKLKLFLTQEINSKRLGESFDFDKQILHDYNWNEKINQFIKL